MGVCFVKRRPSLSLIDLPTSHYSTCRQTPITCLVLFYLLNSVNLFGYSKYSFLICSIINLNIMLMTPYFFQIISPSGGVIVSVPCSRTAHLEYLAYNSLSTPFTHSLDEWAFKYLSSRSFDKVRDFILSGVDFRFVRA